MRDKVYKILFRIFRIIILRRRVFGDYGKGNIFDRNVYTNEMSKVGNHNYLGPYTMLNNVILGNYCSIGPGVKMGQGNHSIDFITTYHKLSSKLINNSLQTNPTIIGNDVWVGANAVIMQDVHIGDGVVIGANAVVTKDIPDYAIAVGVPAKVIKYRFNEQKIKKIKQSKWFEEDYEQALIEIEKIMSN